MVATTILLNGVGSVGKSSVARALQDTLSGPWLYVAMDSFLDMLPDRLHDDPDGFIYRTEIDDEGKSQIAIETGPSGRRLLRGMRRSIAALAQAGNNLIVDDVILDDGLNEYEVLLTEIRFLKVGLFAPLVVLEEREAKREDRLPGLARWQFSRIHASAQYDLEIDTSLLDPAACAQRIAVHFGLQSTTGQDD